MSVNILSKNWVLKVWALGLAVLLEFYFYGPDNSVRVEITVPVEFTNLPSNKIIVNPINAKEGLFTTVYIKGPGPLVQQLQTSNLRFSVDLSEANQRNMTVFLKEAQLRAPSGVQLRLDPEFFKLEIESIVEKSVPVTALTVGELADGFLLDEIKIEPRIVTVVGPESELTDVTTIETQVIEISNISENKSLEMALESPGPLTKLSSKTVVANLIVNAIEARKEIENLNVTVLAPAGFAATAQPSRVKVVLAGPKLSIAQVSRSQIELLVDARSLSPGKHLVAVTGKLPDKVRIIKTEPKNVEVSLASSNK